MVWLALVCTLSLRGSETRAAPGEPATVPAAVPNCKPRPLATRCSSIKREQTCRLLIAFFWPPTSSGIKRGTCS